MGRLVNTGSAYPERATEKNPDKDNRGTPRQLFLELDHQYHFTVDVASTDENALCERHYTKEIDGLTQCWQGETVWCNPPFSAVRPWIEKAVQESQGNCQVVMLLPAWTDLRWFHDLILPFGKVQFLKGRLNFTGGGGAHAPFGCMLCFFPKDRSTKVD